MSSRPSVNTSISATKKRSQYQWMGVLQWLLAGSVVLVLGLQWKTSLGVNISPADHSPPAISLKSEAFASPHSTLSGKVAGGGSAAAAAAAASAAAAPKGSVSRQEREHTRGNLVANIPSPTYNQYLPQWLLNYSAWHTQQRQGLTPDNWKDAGNRYLIMTCLRTAKTCGGLSDRLQHIPGLLRLAAKTNRILFFYWEVPAPLEDFLLPNLPSTQNQQSNSNEQSQAGIDWRLPDWMVPIIFPENGDVGCAMIQKVDTVIQEDKKPKARQQVVCIRSHMPHHGRIFYDSVRQPDEATFRQIYPDLWRYIFVPVPPIAKAVQQEMDRLGLKPGQFVMAHARALYGNHMHDTKWIHHLSRNAVHCAARLVQRIVNNKNSNNHDKIPIFFASDSSLAVETALEYGNGTVVTASKQDGKEPLHLDRANSTTASDYYDIFVDLYLLGNSRCATFNVGGFGRWGALMGHAYSNRTNYTAFNDVAHLNDNLMEPCWFAHNKRDCTQWMSTYQ